MRQKHDCGGRSWERPRALIVVRGSSVSAPRGSYDGFSTELSEGPSTV
jgi:hypothetical protein